MRPLLTAGILLSALSQAAINAQQYQYGDYYGRHDYTAGMPAATQFRSPYIAPNQYGYFQYQPQNWYATQPAAGYQQAGQYRPPTPVYTYPQQQQFVPVAPIAQPMSQPMPQGPATATAPAHHGPAAAQPQVTATATPNGVATHSAMQPAAPTHSHNGTANTQTQGRHGPVVNPNSNRGFTAPLTKTQTTATVGAESKVGQAVSPANPANSKISAQPQTKTMFVPAQPSTTQHTSQEFELAPIKDRTTTPVLRKDATQLPEPKW